MVVVTSDFEMDRGRRYLLTMTLPFLLSSEDEERLFRLLSGWDLDVLQSAGPKGDLADVHPDEESSK